MIKLDQTTTKVLTILISKNSKIESKETTQSTKEAGINKCKTGHK